MEEKKFGLLSSSANPQVLSTTVKGFILGFSGVIIAIGQYFGVGITETEIMEFASNAGIAVGALAFIFGLVQKGVVWIQRTLNL